MKTNSFFKLLIPLLVCILLLTACSRGVVCKCGSEVSDSAVNLSFGYSDFSDVYTYTQDGTQLTYDKTTTAVRVSTDSYSFQSLTSDPADAGAVFSMKVICDKKTYYVNSQTDSVAKNGVEYKTDKNTLTVYYEVSDAAENFSVSLSLVYKVECDRLKVSTDVSQWEISKGATVAEFTLLPYFGAISYESAGLDLESDYFCVPDGVGALIYTKKDSVPSAVLAYDVYSDNVLAPVFAVKQENSAFACVTVRGDASMQIVCNTSEKLKRIYNLYKLAVCEDGKNYVGAYDGEITAVYSFASGSRLSFADVAASARSVFIEYGFFERTDSVDRTTVILDNSDTSQTVYTTEAQALLGLAKGKGIDGINLICRGILSEDVGMSTSEVEDDCGGEKGVSELCSSAMLKGYKIYASAFLRTKDGKSGSLKNAEGERVGFVSYNGETRYFAQTEKITDAYKDFFLNSVASDCGLYVEDASATLFSAENYKGSSSGEQYSAYTKLCENVGEKYGMMSSGGYFLSLKNSDGAVNIPLTCYATTSEAYVCEPFIPAILHGYVLYTSAPVNLQEIPQLAILKAIEYGCGVCVEWSTSEGDSNYYEDGLTESLDYLVTYNEMLSGIRSAEITDHYEVMTDVYCTEYDGKTHVYVNYSNVSAILGDIVIPPYDIIVLN